MFFELFIILVHAHRSGGMKSKLYSITILRTVLHKEIQLRVDNVYYDTFLDFQTFVL